MIKAVIFDLGGVVVDFTNYRHYEHLSRMSGIPTERVKRIIEKRQLDLFERGLETIDTFEREVAGMLRIPRSRVGWYDVYKRSASLNPDVEELVETLHKEYVTAFISNIDKTRYVYTRRILSLDAFDYRFTSCFVGFRKPSPSIFRFALRRMKVKAEETVFIDNMLENVVGARKVGMNAIHFINRRLLDRELAKLSL